MSQGADCWTDSRTTSVSRGVVSAVSVADKVVSEEIEVGESRGIIDRWPRGEKGRRGRGSRGRKGIGREKKEQKGGRKKAMGKGENKEMVKKREETRWIEENKIEEREK